MTDELFQSGPVCDDRSRHTYVPAFTTTQHALLHKACRWSAPRGGHSMAQWNQAEPPDYRLKALAPEGDPGLRNLVDVHQLVWC